MIREAFQTKMGGAWERVQSADDTHGKQVEYEKYLYKISQHARYNAINSEFRFLCQGKPSSLIGRGEHYEYVFFKGVNDKITNGLLKFILRFYP